MNTNQNGHTLRNLTNRVIAVIDDPRQTQAAVETLERAGVADRDLATFSGEEGARQIDAEGVYSGGVKHILRGLQRLTLEGAHLRKYQAELGSGSPGRGRAHSRAPKPARRRPDSPRPRRALHQCLRSVDNRRCRCLTRTRDACADSRG